jgi:hypothetical protein
MSAFQTGGKSVAPSSGVTKRTIPKRSEGFANEFHTRASFTAPDQDAMP